MTQYMFMLFDDESWHDNLTDESWQEAMQAHGAFAEAVEAAGGRILDGNALERSSSATTVRNKPGGRPSLDDGRSVHRDQGGDRRLLRDRGR